MELMSGELELVLVGKPVGKTMCVSSTCSGKIEGN
jgi:hypothetical protein